MLLSAASDSAAVQGLAEDEQYVCDLHADVGLPLP